MVVVSLLLQWDKVYKLGEDGGLNPHTGSEKYTHIQDLWSFWTPDTFSS